MPTPTDEPLLPADTPVGLALAMAAEHVHSGVPEVELEWWADDGTERRLTITVRRMDRNQALRLGAEQAENIHVRNAAGQFTRQYVVPSTPEGLDDRP